MYHLTNCKFPEHKRQNVQYGYYECFHFFWDTHNKSTFDVCPFIEFVLLVPNVTNRDVFKVSRKFRLY